jgi:hypothetical protein
LFNGGGTPADRQIAGNAVWEDVRPMIEINDSLMIHCPQLGGEIPFRYCRTVNDTLPCRRIIPCWEFRTNIVQFLKDHFSVDEMQRFLAPPAKTRIETLIDLIEKAKKIKP